MKKLLRNKVKFILVDVGKVAVHHAICYIFDLHGIPLRIFIFIYQ